MTRGKRHALREPTMRQRNARRSSGAECGSDARHDNVRNTVRVQRLDLFAAASEDERIATLEPRDSQPALRVLNQQLMDARLRGVMIAARFLADEDAMRIASRAIEHGVRHEPVIEDRHQPAEAAEPREASSRSGSPGPAPIR